MKIRLTRKAKVDFIKDKVRGLSGKFFGVTFEKKDGTSRVMNCRTGVSQHTTGEGMSYDPEKKGLMTVWEKRSDGVEGKDAYRSINLREVTRLTLKGVTFHFEDIPDPDDGSDRE